MNRVGKISTKWLVVLALAVSLGFQLATIGRWSIWPDEGYTSMLISYPVKEVVRRTGQDVHPPLYYLLLKAWQGVVGWNAVGLRMLSVVFMLLAIYDLFAGQKTVRGKVSPVEFATIGVGSSPDSVWARNAHVRLCSLLGRGSYPHVSDAFNR